MKIFVEIGDGGQSCVNLRKRVD